MYRVFGHNGFQGTSGVVNCLDGDVLIDGGFTVIQGDDSPWFVIFDRPAGDPIPDSYEVFLEGTNNDIAWDVFGYCFDNPPLRP